MKKRILSMLLILCLVIGIISTAAFATSGVTVEIYRNGNLLGTFSEENRYYHNDTPQIDSNPTGANAVMDFSTNTLTLNNLDLTGQIKVSGGDITVVLTGTNEIRYNSPSPSSPNWLIFCENGDLAIKGPGSLELNSSSGYSSAVHASGKITISDGAKIDGTITGSAQVISGNNVIITGEGTSVKATATGSGHGINVGNGGGTTLTVDDGATLEAVSTNKTALTGVTTLSAAGSTVTVGESAPGSAWDGTTDINTYKYVKIAGSQGGGTTYKDYTITTDTKDAVASVMSGVADVTAADGVITIKLTSNINGRIHFNNNAGNFVLDLNGKTIDPGTTNQAICIDHGFDGSVRVTGSGTLKKGKDDLVYVSPSHSDALKFSLESGYDYYTVQVDGINFFGDGNERLTENKVYTSVAHNSYYRKNTLVLTQYEDIDAKWGDSADALTGSGSIAEALAAAPAPAYIQLQQNVSLDDTAVSNTVTVDLNGKSLTIPDGKTVTVAEDKALTVVNTASGGGLFVQGTVTANGKLDISSLTYGEGGLIKSQGGKLNIGAGGIVTLVPAWVGGDPNAFAVLGTPGEGAYLILGSKAYQYRSSAWVLINKDPMYNTYIDKLFLGILVEGFAVPDGATDYGVIIDGTKHSKKSPIQGGNYVVEIEASLKANTGYIAKPYYTKDGTDTYGLSFYFTTAKSRTAVGYDSYHNRDYYAYAGGKAAIGYGNEAASNGGAVDFIGNNGTAWLGSTYHDGGWAYKFEGSNWSSNWIKTTTGPEVSVYDENGIQAWAVPTTSDDGNFGILTYYIRNASDTAISGFKFGAAADIKVGEDDYAPIEKTNYGISMTDGDNAFVLICRTGILDYVDSPVSTLWFGSYSSARYSVFNNASGNSYNGDSAAAYSWQNISLAPGEVKSFRIAIGLGDSDTLAGLLNSSIDYENEKLASLEANTAYVVTVINDDGTAGETYSLTSDADGKIALSGNDNSNPAKAYDFIGKTIRISKVSNPGTSDEIYVSARPDNTVTPTYNPGDTNPELPDSLEITTTADSITIKAKPGQQYRIGSNSWVAADSSGNVTFTGLTEGTEYTIETRIKATASSFVSTSKEFKVTTKKMFTLADVTVSGSPVYYDATDKVLTITADGATVKYAAELNGEYKAECPKYKNLGTYSIYYKVSNNDYHDYYNVAELKIIPAALTGTVKIVGNMYVGSNAKAEVTNTNNHGTFSYQWYRVGDTTTLIPGATSSTYKLTKEDLNCKMACVVTSSIETGSINGTSAAKVTNMPYINRCSNICTVCGGCSDPDCDVIGCTKKCTMNIIPFTDVKAGQWYTEAIGYVYHHGLMDGVGGNKFDVKGALSRAMIVQILYNREGRPAVGSASVFNDVKNGAWYSDAIAWASMKGIVEGYNGKFDPSAAVTREQLSAILWRYAKYKGYDVSVGEDTNILSYEDAFGISEYAISAMQWACGEGIVSGKPGNILDPIGKATRAETAKMLKAFCENAAK